MKILEYDECRQKLIDRALIWIDGIRCYEPQFAALLDGELSSFVGRTIEDSYLSLLSYLSNITSGFEVRAFFWYASLLYDYCFAIFRNLDNANLYITDFQQSSSCNVLIYQLIDFHVHSNNNVSRLYDDSAFTWRLYGEV